jgi:hypothetical protein
MTRKGLWLASAVVVVSNLWALGLAAVNRQGEPDAVLQLTEREVSLVPAEPENSAVSLRLVWTGLKLARGADWFDQAKLSELGFDCRVLVTRENAKHYFGRPVRRVYAALEFEGPAWQRYLANLAPDRDTTSVHGVSHLMLIDLDLDAARLRTRYPDRTRVAIARAVVDLTVVQEPGRAPRLRGRVLEVLTSDLNLPRDLRREVEPLVARDGAARASGSSPTTTEPRGPRYVATIRWGRQFEPWVDAIRMTDARQ